MAAKQKKANMKRKHLSHLLRFAVAAAALYFAFRGESLSEVGKVFLGLNFWVFAAALSLYAAGQFLFVCRWRLFLWAQSIHINFWTAVRLHFLGLFYNNCMPGSVGGDLLRAWYVTKHTDKKVEAALSVFVDRAVGLACTVAVVLVFFWFVPSGEQGGKLKFSSGGFEIGSKIVSAWPIFVGLAVVLLLIVIGICLNKKARQYAFGLVKLFESRWASLVIKVLKAIKLYLCRPAVLLSAVVLTFVCQAMPIIGLWLIGRDLGIDANLKYYFMFFPLSWIIGVIPISVGGAGVMELGLKGMFGQVTTVSQSQGLILGLAQRVIWLLTSLPGVVIHLAGKHLPSEELMEAEIEQ